MANISTGFSREAVDQFPDDPNDRDMSNINELVRQLRTTAFFQALPEERQESSFWYKVLREAEIRRDLRANAVLYDARMPAAVHGNQTSPQALSPTQQRARARKSMMLQRSGTGMSAGPENGFKTDHFMSKLFIVLSGGVQVVKDDAQVKDGEPFGEALMSQDRFQTLAVS